MTPEQIDSYWAMLQMIFFVAGLVWLFMNFIMMSEPDIWSIELIIAINVFFVIGMLAGYGLLIWVI